MEVSARSEEKKQYFERSNERLIKYTGESTLVLLSEPPRGDKIASPLIEKLHGSESG